MFLQKARELSQSSSFRFALLAMLLIWLTIVAVLFMMYTMIRAGIWNELDRQLKAETEALVQASRRRPLADLEVLFREVQIRNDSIITADGSLYLSRPGMMQNRPSNNQEHRVGMMFARPPRAMVDQLSSSEKDNPNRTLSRTVKLANGQTVSLSKNTDLLYDLDRIIIHALIIGLSLTFILALSASVLLTRRSVSRINSINDACQTIMSGHLDHRIPIDAQRRADDYEQMAQNINAMLDRIQELMTQVRQVSDNIAHDLKSPLTHLRTRLEMMQQSPQDHTEELAEAINDADRLLGMFKSLLGIARLEASQLQDAQAVEIAHLLTDACEMYQPIFEQRSIVFSADIEDATLSADPNLLFQAISNLLDNAAKYTPEQGQVRLYGYREHGSYIIRLHDSGSGIDEALKEKVFERFVRLDQARTSPGFGLGLSQVKAIIKLHGGQIVLDNDKGLLVTVTLPI